ncbi:hypothetical protein NLG97_g9572 [Lecanicillium saksenae]|uniref:Uncharacterized protein n=1 Tax=Lecanicillium saksenae TaxID=468837 RepID=A0ACC1QIM4_9HYPO|nr:hypothetical protein NLG97_g9572 [Lecanicillium saksenae]
MASPSGSDYGHKDDSGVVSEPLAITNTTQTSSNASTVDVDENSHLTVFQAVKKWKRVFWYSLAISSSILMFGYDFVIVGNSSSMPAFQYVARLCSPFQQSPLCSLALPKSSPR